MVLYVNITSEIKKSDSFLLSDTYAGRHQILICENEVKSQVF